MRKLKWRKTYFQTPLNCGKIHFFAVVWFCIFTIFLLLVRICSQLLEATLRSFPHMPLHCPFSHILNILSSSFSNLWTLLKGDHLMRSEILTLKGRLLWRGLTPGVNNVRGYLRILPATALIEVLRVFVPICWLFNFIWQLNSYTLYYLPCVVRKTINHGRIISGLFPEWIFFIQG